MSKFDDAVKKAAVNDWNKSGSENMTSFCKDRGISPRSLKRWIDKFGVTNNVSKFEIGDEVVIRSDSRWYGQGNYNPVDQTGKIVGFKDSDLDLNIRVEWENGIRNSYNEKDLDMVEEDVVVIEDEYSYIITAKRISIFKNGVAIYVSDSDERFLKIQQLLIEGKVAEAHQVADIKETITKYSKGELVVENGEVHYKGFKINGKLANRLVKIVSGEDVSENITTFTNFFTNLMNVGDERVINELYDFLKHNDVELNEDGTFTGWKAIRNDWMDKHSGTILNKVGTTVQMPRHLVDDDCNRTCSSGLHVGSIEYVRMFGNEGRGDRLVKVKVDPKNVVSVPVDYSGQKLRACEYTVIEEVSW